MKHYLWLAFALLVEVVGAVVGRLLKLSTFPAIIVIMVPGFLALFPFMKRRMPKATFGYWVFVAVISTVAGWLIYRAFS